MRYGHQGWLDLMAMSIEEIFEMSSAISDLVCRENDTSVKDT